MNTFKISEFTVIAEIPSQDEEKKAIVYSTRSTGVITVKMSSLDAVREGRLEDLTDEEISTLTRYMIIVPEEENEIEEVLHENTYMKGDKSMLTYTIQPTGNCQLGCHYCGQVHSKIKMTEYIVLKSFQRIEKTVLKEGYQGVSVTWYGGEPSMALAEIESFTEKMDAFCEEHDKIYVADIITNGLSLKENIFNKMVEKLHIKAFQITIDGTKEHHDKRRMTKSGNDTFDIIYNNVVNCVNSETFKKFKPSISIRINIDRENSPSVEQFVRNLKESNILDKVGLSFSPVFDWGGNNANSKSLSVDEFSNKEIDWLLLVDELGGTVGSVIPKRTAASCMVDNKDSEVFDAYGNIFSCYELPYTEKYQNKEYIEGNVVKQGETPNKDLEIRNWQNHVKERKYSNCIDCKFYPVCGGGCPKDWIEGRPACPPFKYNMEDKLLLHYFLEKNKNTTETFTNVQSR